MFNPLLDGKSPAIEKRNFLVVYSRSLQLPDVSLVPKRDHHDRFFHDRKAISKISRLMRANWLQPVFQDAPKVKWRHCGGAIRRGTFATWDALKSIWLACDST